MTYQQVCPVSDTCTWRGPLIDDKPSAATDNHIWAVHPEVIEPDPTTTGQRYTRPLYARYRRVESKEARCL